MPINDSTTPYTVEGLLRVVEERDAEVVLLKLMVDKLKLQLMRGLRARFGASSEQLNDPQMTLLESEPLYERPTPIVPAAAGAANAPQIDRKLPDHLPRESQVYIDRGWLQIYRRNVGPLSRGAVLTQPTSKRT